MCAFVLASWCAWALVILPLLPPTIARGEWVGVGARVVFWLVPGAIYLRRVYGKRWLSPLWLRVGPSRLHLAAILFGTVFVSLLLLLGTAQQRGVPLGTLWDALTKQAQPALRTPIMEELIFRGVVVGEACRLALRNSQGAVLMRIKYWGAQLGAAIFFTLIHWPYWLGHRGLDFALKSSGPLLVTALVLGAMFIHTRSLWPCIFLHWLNNQLSTLTLS